jgi:hypothetical protein
MATIPIPRGGTTAQQNTTHLNGWCFVVASNLRCLRAVVLGGAMFFALFLEQKTGERGEKWAGTHFARPFEVF